MKHTPKEIAELLKDKPHQPHYIESLVKKAIEEERYACARIVEESNLYDISPYYASEVVTAIKFRSNV